MNTEILYEDVKNEVLNYYKEKINEFKSLENGWNGKGTYKIQEESFTYFIEFMSKLHYELRKNNYDKIKLSFFNLFPGNKDVWIESNGLLKIYIEIDTESNEIIITYWIKENDKIPNEENEHKSFSINISNILIPEYFILWLIKNYSILNS